MKFYLSVVTGMMVMTQGIAFVVQSQKQSSFRIRPFTFYATTNGNFRPENEKINSTSSSSRFQTTTTTNTLSNEFVNDGIFAWMVPYLTAIGIQPGKTIQYGPIAFPTNTTAVPLDLVEQRRMQATMELINIGPEERKRRQQASRIMYFVTGLYLLWSTFLGDDGTWMGHVVRMGTVLPLFLAYGYQKSATTGL